MKKTLLIGLLSTSALIAGQTEINTSISVERGVEPSIMQASFSYQNTEKTAEPLLEAFSKINEKVVAYNEKHKDTPTKCKGGQNKISPQYTYKNSVRKFRHYRGSLSYVCKFDDIKSYNALIGSSLFGSEKITLNPIQWTLDKDEVKRVQLELSDELLQEAKSKAVHYAKLLDKPCYISKINLGHRSMPTPKPMMARAERSMVMGSSKAVDGFEPTKDSQTISASASISYLCGKAIDINIDENVEDIKNMFFDSEFIKKSMGK